MTKAEHPPTAEQLRATFDAADQFTVGLEDEVMLLDPQTLELADRAPEVVALFDGDARFKLELPASQLEIVTEPCARVADAVSALSEGRRVLAKRTRGVVMPAAAAVHPFSSARGALNRGPRYERTISEYASVAERQLVCAFQVHVAVPGADRALAVYNAARSYLPLLAAVAANGPFYEGRDTGLASVRPLLAALLPRQGVPPAIASWEEYADAISWGESTGMFPTPGTWWWELRLHPRVGTLEFRVPDGQTRLTDTAAVAAFVQALVVWLAERHDAGECLPVAPRWRIEENRWSACRHGAEGTMAELDGRESSPTRAVLEQLLTTLDPVAARLEAGAELRSAAELVDHGGAALQREVAADGGPVALAKWLAECFLEGVTG